jgi:hypothetical protein
MAGAGLRSVLAYSERATFPDRSTRPRPIPPETQSRLINGQPAKVDEAEASVVQNRGKGSCTGKTCELSDAKRAAADLTSSDCGACPRCSRLPFQSTCRRRKAGVCQGIGEEHGFLQHSVELPGVDFRFADVCDSGLTHSDQDPSEPLTAGSLRSTALSRLAVRPATH